MVVRLFYFTWKSGEGTHIGAGVLNGANTVFTFPIWQF